MLSSAFLLIYEIHMYLYFYIILIMSKWKVFCHVNFCLKALIISELANQNTDYKTIALKYDFLLSLPSV